MTTETKPRFGLKRETRSYRCTICGHVQLITTNHTDQCLNYCPECSWKGIGYGQGVYLFGALHRIFTYDGDNTP